MTETPTAAPSADVEDEAAKKPARKAAAKAPAKSGGLSSMLLADLKSMAAGLGIAGAGSMKKAQLVDAIKASQNGAAKADVPSGQPASDQPGTDQPGTDQPGTDQPGTDQPGTDQVAAADEPAARTTVRTRTRKQRQAEQAEAQQSEQKDQQKDQQKQDQKQEQKQKQDDKQDRDKGQQNQQQSQKQQDQKQQDQKQQDRDKGQQPNQSKQGQQNQQNQQNQQGQNQADDEDEEGGSRRNRRRRGRDRTGVRTGGRNEPDTTILEDDVLVPAAGILDVLDNCAFVRTSGYLPGPEDVYLSLSMVRKYHLRRGDAVVGQVRQPREGERREKFNPMVRIDSINGSEAEGAKERPEFSAAVPVHPHQRLRLATDDTVVGKVIDIAAPVGKGQRGLILTPPRTGATSLLQSIAQAVTTNNPECHVMVVLVDARPEEVTDFQRAVKGEVVASTFDRQPADHTLVAELAIERAKRLVELGHDVVVLLDSLTRLGRAYNLAAPANGRVLAGIVDASAVHPTKEFFGAARKIEDAGSLTVLATVAVGTGSATDEFFLEEIAGTENWELALSADRAAKGISPAVDVAASGTRHEEKLLAPAEGAVVGDLRKQLAAADSPQALNKVVGSR